MKVGELIALLESRGWFQVRQKGSHRQFQHPSRKGTVTVSGKAGVDVPVGTLHSVLKQTGLKQEYSPMRYMVVIEQGSDSFGAYVPDLPGCIAAAETREEVLRLIREAIEFHLEGLKDEGTALPQPHSFSEFVEVRA
jgi:predicted RNA binding protein YcfA (HicA-like mRNA interferase family)/predicted RNase H-like HicB family nuclease